MNSAEQRTLDEILFEHRNKEYGSFKLRRQYLKRLAISFLISLSVLVLLVLAYSWYLYAAGDETVYLYSTSSPYLKSTEGSLLSPEELNAFTNPTPPREENTETQTLQKSDVLRSFVITEDAPADTFIPKEDMNLPSEEMTDQDSSNDSIIFGGFLTGDGKGAGGGGGQIDRFPVFPNGPLNKYIETVLRYPPQAVKQKIQGIVMLSFVVNKSGEVVNVKVEKSVNPLLDAEAVKVIKSLPRWQPGLRYGRPVQIQIVIPVNFSL